MRLVFKPRQKKAVTLSGDYSIGGGNRLIYKIKEEAAFRREYDLPESFDFGGRWQIGQNDELELAVPDKGRDPRIKQLVLSGKIISVSADELTFEIKCYDRQGFCHFRTLKLSGKWQADNFNRLCFLVTKSGEPDRLTFKGSWELNSNQQIVYSYENTRLRTKTKSVSRLLFQGHWQINSARRLRYILEGSTDSYFDFRVQLESPSLYPKQGQIRYRIGIGVKGRKGFCERTLCLYGAWKFGRRLGLVFEMDYGRGRPRSIEFGASLDLDRKNRVIFSLLNKQGDPLGLSLTFQHSFLRKLDAQAFLRLRKAGREKRAEAGVYVPF